MVQKEKCDCQGLMLAALAVGVLIGLVGGLALGWNGAIYPSETSFILSMLTAVGTVGAAIGAIYAARIAIKLGVEGREQALAEKKNRAENYIISIWAHLHRAETLFDTCELTTENGRVVIKHFDRFEAAVNILDGIDSLQAADASKLFCKKISGTRTLIAALQEAYLRGAVFRYKQCPDGEWINKNGETPMYYELAQEQLKLCEEASASLLRGEGDWEDRLK